ncbi:fatty acid desaturase-domain-containing protein [Tricladium varicosporioides]|nr:fatty acid desaturase-domain-containing protein [Hymenoscyphus varicosporioides]
MEIVKSSRALQTKPASDMTSTINLKALRASVPDYCFKPSLIISLYYLFRDLVLSAALIIISSTLIPILPTTSLRIIAWSLYGWLQGLVFTGLWVLGHECGHGAFSTSKALNDRIGFALHSTLLTPYFAWRSTHRRHHLYTSHMDKDNNHVPLRRADYLHSFGAQLNQNVQDTPLYVLWRLLLQQFLGWPLYLMYGITGGSNSTARKPNGEIAERSHFNPGGAFFFESEFNAVVISDVGIATAVLSLVWIGRTVGFSSLFLLYGQPFLWLNQWIVALTYLQHTHPNIPRHEAASWTFAKGATATVDRDIGIIGRFFLHNVIDCHVVHHLFPSIPFYYAPEATRVIRPVLGGAYHEDKQNLLLSLWKTFRGCQYVDSDDSLPVNDRALWFQPGNIPPLRPVKALDATAILNRSTCQ